MSNSDTYQYRPLISAKEIRLLLLQPGGPGSDIHCSLSIPHYKNAMMTLRKLHRTFVCMRDASQTRVIFIDKRPSQITINLAAALDDLRHQHIILRIWSDLTMNEEEEGERMEVTHAIEEIESEEEEDEKSQRSRANWSGLTCSEEEYGPRMLVTDVIEEEKRRWRREEAESEENSDYRAGLNERALIGRFYDMNEARRSHTTLFTVMLSRRGSRPTVLRDLVYGYFAVAGLPLKRNYPPCLVVDYRKSVVDYLQKPPFTCLKRTGLAKFSSRPMFATSVFESKDFHPGYQIGHLIPLNISRHCLSGLMVKFIMKQAYLGNRFTSEVR